MALTFNGKEVNTVNFNNNVGYTVVGNPTINTGVVSGFSANDYIYANQQIDFNQIDNFEAVIAMSNCGQGIKGYTSLMHFAFRTWVAFTNAGNPTFELNTKRSGESSYTRRDVYDFSYEINTDGPIYLKFTKINNVFKLQYSLNGVNFSNGVSYTLKEGEEVQVGGMTDNGVKFSYNQRDANYSVNLNETYIKVNGITWFNGKQQASADVNYVIKDGKLVWANPNLYLRAPARSSAEQGLGTPIINTGVTITDHTYGLDLRYRAYQLPWEGLLMLGNISSYRYQIDRISLFGTTTDFSKRTDYSACRMVYNGPANTASLYWGDGTSETIEITSGTNFNIGPQRLGSTWDYNTGFDYYYYKLFKAGSLICHFVPVPTGLKIGDYTVPSNGMWDIVTQTFFGNQGTGSFTFGKDDTTSV